jgi:hypothetical protein
MESASCTSKGWGAFSRNDLRSEPSTDSIEKKRVVGELGALLDKEFLAQDLPKFRPNAEKASGALTEAV